MPMFDKKTMKERYAWFIHQPEAWVYLVSVAVLLVSVLLQWALVISVTAAAVGLVAVVVLVGLEKMRFP